MTFDQVLSLAKIINAIYNNNSSVKVTKRDKEIAAESLKLLADQRCDWTQEQKELYKVLVDYVK